MSGWLRTTVRWLASGLYYNANHSQLHMNPSKPAESQPVSVPQPPGDGVRRVRLSDWMGEHKVMEIEHGGQVYRLQITRQSKLILTK